MSKEKQIDIIRDLLIEFDEMGFIPITAVPDPEAYAIKWRDAITKALEDYFKQSEWISVEERLPEDVYKDRKIITVLVCTKSGRVSTSSRVRMMMVNKEKMNYEYTDIFEWSGQIAKKVTHWMPLPEAPKGGE